MGFKDQPYAQETNFQFLIWNSSEVKGAQKTGLGNHFQFSVWDSWLQVKNIRLPTHHLSILCVRFNWRSLSRSQGRPLSFNSLCEIPKKREIWLIQCKKHFQFSVWDSPISSSMLCRASQTFNSLCEILSLPFSSVYLASTLSILCVRFLDTRSAAQPHLEIFQFSVWDSLDALVDLC